MLESLFEIWERRRIEKEYVEKPIDTLLDHYVDIMDNPGRKAILEMSIIDETIMQKPYIEILSEIELLKNPGSLIKDKEVAINNYKLIILQKIILGGDKSFIRR